MDWYKDKRILLTGATSGIGKQLLEKLSGYGAYIVAVGRDISHLKATSHVFPFSCDVSRRENMDELFDFALGKLGAIDIFFANAGFGYCEQLQKADWNHMDNIFRTNVYSPIYGLEKMIEISGEKEFFYVITASGVAQTPLAGFSLYTATKFAVDGFSQAMHLELPPHIHLTTVYPVAMKTEFFERSGEGSPLPPIFHQKPEVVVNKILKGVSRKKKYIRPMPLFNFTVWLLNVFPFMKPIGLKWSARGFRKWTNKNK